ncbi:MAG: SGNH/GDSL hydrolase family protein [Chitinophagales bacterium]|nr:SGNH/GDSL hydrolase family protein [Chitinophagales bacterium]
MQSSYKEYSLLCLGDSYTIGERVDEADRFPNQTVLQLHSKGIYLENPRIIATTGWTTDELLHAIEQADIRQNYDFVTLLIGVNNQYRGRSAADYRKEFVDLLQLAIRFAAGNKLHVVVLSIPDWGATPFAEGRDRLKIAEEIDLFNAINKEESEKYGVHYIDVTAISRKGLNDLSLLTDDGLHPSAKMYAEWATLLTTTIAGVVNQSGNSVTK